MSQQFEQLHAKLAELENELNSIEIDSQSRKEIRNTLEEISLAIKEEQAETLPHDSLAERLNKATEQFEASHPTLVRIVGSVIDALGQIGI